MEMSECHTKLEELVDNYTKKLSPEAVQNLREYVAKGPWVDVGTYADIVHIADSHVKYDHATLESLMTWKVFD